ncbi:hypothetical protein X975_08221, partial [Stegodyphus mimosarum]
MEKIQYRAVINYLFLKGNISTQINRVKHSVQRLCTISNLKFWVAEFKCGCTSLDDDEHSGQSKTATTDENIGKIHQMVLDNH